MRWAGARRSGHGADPATLVMTRRRETPPVAGGRQAADGGLRRWERLLGRSPRDPFAPPPVRLPWLKRHRLGRVLVALRRRRRTPVTAVRAEVADRRDRRAGRIPPPPRRRPEVRSIFSMPVGPGDRGAVLDGIDAILASDGDAAQVIVVDDASVDSRAGVVRDRYPQVDVVRQRVPSGGPPRLWPGTQLGLRRALERYDFEQFVKLDADALVTAPEFSERTLARLRMSPRPGIAGSFGLRSDGSPWDYGWHAAVLETERRGDRVLAAAADAAMAAGWTPGEMVHGGVLCVTRPACEALRRDGRLEWRQPFDSLASEDFLLSLFVRAAGFEFVSTGGPDGILATANKHLPLPKEEIAEGPWVAAHSVRFGLDGEDEAELRAFFRARRSEWRTQRSDPAARPATTAARQPS